MVCVSAIATASMFHQKAVKPKTTNDVESSPHND